MFLSNDEMRDLTGYMRHADQRKWLTARGWLFEVAATGRPIVSKAHAESRLNMTAPAAGPNLAALRRRA